MVDLLPSAEQAAVVKSVSEYLAKEAPVSRYRDRRAAGEAHERDLLKGLADLGWLGVALPEWAGGAGLSVVEEMLVFREAGRHLLSPGVLASVLGAHLAAAVGERDLARAIARGERAVAMGNLLRPVDLSDGAAAELQVFDGEDCDLVLVWTPQQAALLDASGLEQLQKLPALDDSLSFKRGRLSGAPAAALLNSNDGDFAARANVLVCGMLLGIADAATALAVEHARTREQFGKPIGAFQAIKHACADMEVRNEAARQLLVFAALSHRDGRPDRDFQVAGAKIVCEDAAVLNASANIQIHGGMGFTEECDAHLFLKRAQLVRHLGGSASRYRSVILEGPEPA